MNSQKLLNMQGMVQQFSVFFKSSVEKHFKDVLRGLK